MIRQFLFAALLTVFGITAVTAQPGMGRRAGFGQGPRHEALMDKLNLTDAQETQMQKLRIGLMKKQSDLRSKIHNLRLDIKSSFLADKVDRNAIEKNLKAITVAQEQLKMNMLDHWFAVNTILSADQQKIWKQHAVTMGARLGRDDQRGGRGFFRERFRGNWDND